MKQNEDKQIVLYYLRNLISSGLSSRNRDKVLDWAVDNSADLFGMPSNKEEDAKKDFIKKELSRLAKRKFSVKLSENDHKNKIVLLCKAFDIKGNDKKCLEFLLFADQIQPLADLYDELKCRGFAYKLLAAFTGLTIRETKEVFANDSELISNGFIKHDGYNDFNLADIIEYTIRYPLKSVEDVRAWIVDAKIDTHLTKDDFAYVKEDFGHISGILKSALKNRSKGINILLYGHPGTGKTEMSKALCKEIGVDLYSLSEKATGDETGECRLKAALTADTLLKGSKKAVILFDEADDAFCRYNYNSKLFINRMLERNNVPRIFIMNDVSEMDAAFLRRFSYVMELDIPPVNIRKNIWQKIVTDNNVRLSEERITSCATKYKISPSFIEKAIQSVKLTGDESAIERTLQGMEKAICGKIESYSDRCNSNFNPELLNTDTDLSRLTKQIKTRGLSRFSLCLFGVPGTGKSEYARHLAQEIGMEVIHKRASDLQSCWVGGTEKNIAKAFADARRDKALLIFDEADSFLQDREMATKSWEISAVNEMLTWMESHPYPFVCTTNMMDRLDKASLRRFTFKVKYDYLSNEQVEIAFKHFFRLPVQRKEIDVLNHLTPGDFMVVKNKTEILGINDKSQYLSMLVQEQEAKGIKTTKMGFQM